jgi:VCBS repeat-containing protein
LSLADVTATGGGTDYTSVLTNAAFNNGVTIVGGVITVPIGVTSFTVTVPTTADVLNEANETYTLTVGGASGTGTITDNDPTPSLSINDVSVNEAAGTATFTVTLSAASGQTVTVDYNTSSGTATMGSDFTGATGTLTFAPGTTTQTITVAITNDTIYEGATAETFNVNLVTPVNATISDNLGIGSIVDNDAVPTVSSVTSASAIEATSIVHTVNLSNASSTTTTFALSLADVTATGGGTDYTSVLTNAAFNNGVTIVGGVITVPVGVTSFTVTVPTTADTIYEPNETYTLTVGAASGTGTINNDDPVPTISTVSNASATEASNIVHTVTLSNASYTTTTFALSLGGGTATSGGVDYTSTLTNAAFNNGVTISGGNITIPAGVTSFTVTVPTTSDTIYEPNETYTLTVGSASGTGTINDNDPAPTVSTVSNASATEASSIVHTVTLSNASSTATTFALNLGGGTATGGGVDYTSTLTNAAFNNGVTISAGTITIPTGVTSFTVTVPTTSDVLDEANETYTLTVGSASGIGTIVDDDPTPSLTINDVTVNEAAGTASFTVTLSAASGQTVTVGYNTSSGTATMGTDFTSTTGTLTFNPGVITQTITVPITNDTMQEPNETFFVNLVTPTNATISDAQGVGTIIDNDSTPTISTVSAASQTEGGSIVHTVTLSNTSSSATTFAYSIGGGTATIGTDYNGTPTFSNGVTLSSGILTVPAGVTSFTVTVATIQDTIYELNETYNLTVGGVVGIGTINNDDAVPTLSIVGPTVAEVDNSYAVFNLNLSNPTSTNVVVGLSFGGGTATAGVGTTAGSATDYGDNTQMQVSTDGGATWSAIGTNTVTIPGGSSSALVRTWINQNTGGTEAASETFVLTGTVSSGNTSNASTTGTGTIIDNTVTVSSPMVTEGATLTYAVNTSAHAAAISLSFSLTGTASAADYGSLTFSNGVTYNAVTGLITIPAGVTAFNVTLPTIDDTLDEPAETAIVTIGGISGTGTINDNDPTPSISINDVTVNEAAGTATFTVTLSAASGNPITVDYSTAAGTAAVGTDFTAASGTLNFAPGVSTQTITVNIANDTLYEGLETFKVDLSNVTNATISDSQGIGTIADNGTGAGGTDNDTPTFAVSNVAVSDQSPGFANFIVSLSNASTAATAFSFALANGTATGGGTDYGAAGATNLQVSTDNGATWSNATTATIPAYSTYVLVRTPITADVLNEVSESFTLTATRTSGTTTNATATGTGTITDVYTGPDAINDAPSTILIEDNATTTLAGNAILGGSGNVADTDPNNDTLAITGAVAGTGAVVGAVPLSSPLTVNGIYGPLVIAADGSYTYTLDNARIQTQNLINGQNATDVFTYKITDGNGGYDTATITVTVQGTLDITAITPQPVAIATDGLSGEYYGYNDTVTAGNRVHADDTTATSLGTSSNIESVEDVELIINGRNAAMGGSASIVGTANAGATDAADVKFAVRTLDYGISPAVDGDLGANQGQAAGSLLLPQDNVALSTTRALGNFLDQDAATAIVQTGTPTGATVGTQTGLGTTTDAIIRMTGFVYLERGNYDFRVTADDGFRLKVGGETLLEFDGNQPPTTRTYNNVEVSDLISGLTSIELLYWEQGGNAQLQFEFKLSSSATWAPFSLDSIAFFSTTNAPTLTDTRIQDIIETSTNQVYELRTGSVLDGDGNTNTLTGDAGRDYIQGFGGDDILNGFGSADYLDGGTGNDTLNGGDGNDILIGGTGNDSMTGGLGDDIYHVDSAGDVVVELAGEGTDTIEIEATYNPGTYTLAANFENLLIDGSANINGIGNASANRMTGNDGNNSLSGLGGDDRLVGGKGNDTLTGGTGNDIFEWNLADKGAPGAPAIDTVTDFTYGAAKVDSLDLRDLLVGESSTELVTGGTPVIGNLLNYLDVVVAAGTTTIHISSTGGFTGGTYAPAAEDQRIVLTGVDLFNLTGTATEATLLQALLKNGTLVVD